MRERSREPASIWLTGAGRRLKVAVTDMSQPLGDAVGNALDIVETVEVLRGDAPGTACVSSRSCSSLERSR